MFEMCPLLQCADFSRIYVSWLHEVSGKLGLLGMASITNYYQGIVPHVYLDRVIGIDCTTKPTLPITLVMYTQLEIARNKWKTYSRPIMMLAWPIHIYIC